MKVYISNRQISDKIFALYESTGKYPEYIDVLRQLLEEDAFMLESPNKGVIAEITKASDEDFPQNIGDLCWEFDTEKIKNKLAGSVLPGDAAGWSSGYPSHVFMNSVFYREASSLHRETEYFECNYVYSGKCDFYFEKQKKELLCGDLCIISPSALHNVRIRTADTLLIQLYLHYDTFSSAFISLLSDENILSNFFRAILLNRSQANYLLLSTGESEEIHYIAKHLYLEYFRYDQYAPQCTTDRTRIFFANVLRRMDKNYSFSSPSESIDFGPIMRYLNTNYRTASLADVADYFHYSTSYLSIMIKKLTGKTYTELIRELKMTDAAHYLIETRKSIEEISTLTGYNSSDQFTRTFRTTYGFTPTQYRKKYRG